MNPTKLRLIDGDEPTAEAVYMARIEQSHREWSKQGWHPVDVAATRPLVVDDVTTYKVIVVDRPIPLWRRILRRLKGQQQC